MGNIVFAPLIGHSRYNYRKIVGVCFLNFFLRSFVNQNNLWFLTQFIYVFFHFPVFGFGFGEKFPYFGFNF